jgi:hypothetical protein
MKSVSHAKRGRPSKFGRPGRVVAVTLPDEVVHGLRRIHPDLGWAIVSLFEKGPARTSQAAKSRPDAELVTFAERRSLIVVNRAMFRNLPGINIIPLDRHKAFLALEVGRGMTDLELAVIDRLDDSAVGPRERKALRTLRSQLRIWRHDHALRFHSRAIIVVEQPRRKKRRIA